MADDGQDDAELDNGADPTEKPLETELERTRRLILERRNTFMAAALAGIGLAGGQACTRASVCLSSAIPEAGSSGAGQTGGSGGTVPDGSCPGQPWKRPPCVCLSLPMGGTIAPPPFAGTVAPPLGGTVAPPIAGTGGAGGTRPNVCLSAPIDAGPDAGPNDDDASTENEP